MRPFSLALKRLAPGVVAAVVVLALAAVPAVAQVEDTIGVPVDSVVVSPDVPVTALPGASDSMALPVTPRGAFIRSMIVPGWGQSEFGSYFRGGVFFAGWAANWFMNFKNAVRLDEARDILGIRRGHVRDSLLTSAGSPEAMAVVLGLTDVLDRTLRADSLGTDLRRLIRAREQQREDWIAWSIFWILASGVDGYVTAHLADFPAAIDVESNQDGSVSLELHVPLGRRRP